MQLMTPYTAFSGHRLVASGELVEVARQVKTVVDGDPQAAILFFDNTTSRQVEVDFRGSWEDVLSRLPVGEEQTAQNDKSSTPRPGRPKLGVVPREVTLLPRHWDWLATQRGGASVTLRRLVDEARRESAEKDKARAATESLDRFMNVMAGDLPHYEEASRAFYRKEQERFARIIEAWPEDVRRHALMLAAEVWKVSNS